jgi:hypothetical protein
MSKLIRGHVSMAMPIFMLALVATALPTISIAAELVACEVLQSDDSVRIEITAEGEWSHRSFRVEDPERFVLDLIGVDAGEVSPRIAAGDRFVSAVRIAQYKGAPDAVTRIVLDLVNEAGVTVERSDNGLALVAYRTSADVDAGLAGRGCRGRSLAG